MLESALSTLPAWISVGAGGGAGFFFIKWIFDWVGARVDKREDAVEASFARLDKGTQALIEHLQREVRTLSDRVTRQDGRIETLEGELKECRVKHADAEARVKHLEAVMQGYGDARQKAQLIVSAELDAERKGEAR